MKKKATMTRTVAATIIGGSVLFLACGPSPQDVNELRDQQKQILAKLAEIEKKIDNAVKAPQPPQQRPSGPDPAKAYEIPVAGSALKGPENAPVTITAFSDYQCPFCARAEPIINDVLKAYPDKVRYMFKNLPLVSIHRQAMPAAKAALAAHKQGKYWEMHEKIFANQRALEDAQIRQYAQEIGLDMTRFEADMKSPEVEKQVQDEMALANKLGIRGTPTIFVNGKLNQNRSVDGFKSMIDSILAGKG